MIAQTSIASFYSKITSLDELEEDAKYLIVCEDKSVAMGAIDGGKGAAVSVSIVNNTVVLDKVNQNGFPYEVTITKKKNTEKYYLYVSGKKLLSNADNPNISLGSDDVSYSLTFYENDSVKIASNAYRKIAAYSDVFGNYTMNYQYAHPIQLYKKIESDVVLVTVGEAGIGTFCSERALDFTGVEDIRAYRATEIDGTTVRLQQVNGAVALRTGLVLVGKTQETTTAELPVVSEGTEYGADENLLKAVLEGERIPASNGGTYNYVFGKPADGAWGFYKLAGTGMTATANLAYLSSSTDALATDTSVRGLSFSFDDGQTDISNAKASARSTVIYNAMGQRVGTPRRGLYIVNGHKKIIK